ncbi:hypothetical protein ACIBD9_25140 [Micromonospora sp. NPDC050784]|uniref:hypothetical protein n=1 Tax=Micromonospora sp. NPDC050784 TaxID=3364281 RepID=UPI003799901A
MYVHPGAWSWASISRIAALRRVDSLLLTSPCVLLTGRMGIVPTLRSTVAYSVAPE